MTTEDLTRKEGEKEFSEARFEGLVLKGKSVTSREFHSCLFKNCDLTGALLTRSRFTSCRFESCNWYAFCMSNDLETSRQFLHRIAVAHPNLGTVINSGQQRIVGDDGL